MPCKASLSFDKRPVVTVTGRGGTIYRICLKSSFRDIREAVSPISSVFTELALLTKHIELFSQISSVFALFFSEKLCIFLLQTTHAT